MLKAGLELGGVAQVLPGCRRLLRDGGAHVWHAHHYLMLFAFGTSPLWILVFTTLCVFVLPKFQQIGQDMGVVSLGLMGSLLDWSGLSIAGQAMLVLALWLGAILYCGGPRLTNWLARHSPFSWDRLASLVPWRQRRMQRDFSTVLAVALDAGLPEARAIMLAGEGTGNEVFRARAVAAVQDLQRGKAATAKFHAANYRPTAQRVNALPPAARSRSGHTHTVEPKGVGGRGVRDQERVGRRVGGEQRQPVAQVE